MDVAIMEQVAGEFAAYLSEVGDGDLTMATPCKLWTIDDLFHHMVEESVKFGQKVNPRPTPPSSVGSCARREIGHYSCSLREPVYGSSSLRERIYRDSARYAIEALAEFNGTVNSAGGMPSDLSLEDVFYLHLASTLIHAWDLASAMQFEFDLPDERVLERAIRSIRQLPPGARGDEKSFGEIMEFPVNSTMDELLLLSGRFPEWHTR
jgi:uncharacterized protein (TIGR03083 family)